VNRAEIDLVRPCEVDDSIFMFKILVKHVDCDTEIHHLCLRDEWISQGLSLKLDVDVLQYNPETLDKLAQVFVLKIIKEGLTSCSLFFI